MRTMLKSVVLFVAASVVLAGCGGGGGGLKNSDPGNNDVNVVVALGDSITQGSECPCTPYPARAAGATGLTFVNCGVGGSRAADNVGRAKQAIDKYHPGFMVILYGVNDIIMSRGIGSIVSALGAMVDTCKENHVVPVLMTYPLPITGHEIFQPRTRTLNEQIRSLASSKGVKCVNLESEFDCAPELYMEDGLHPNDAGTGLVALAVADLF